MASHRFQSIESFEQKAARYRLLPFRFMRWSDQETLVTNDVGEHVFLSSELFSLFCIGSLSRDTHEYRQLKARHFLQDSQSTVPLELLSTKYRSKNAFLEGFTRLHLFVVTLRCDHSCQYCQVSRVTPDKKRFDMTEQTADRAVNLMFRSPAAGLKMEFQGGEPLLNFELIRWLIERAEAQNQTEQRQLEFVVASNLALLTDEMLSFFAEHNVCLSTSLDGPASLHNANRPRPDRNSHALLVGQLERARQTLGRDRISAIMTTTKDSLRYPREIVDEYVRLGFDSIFLRNISPYGFAVRSTAGSGYQLETFLTFYKKALEHIIELNRRGTPIVETYAQVLLRKMLTPFSTGYVDLQSPAGAGIGVVVYNYDGQVYASDEGRMLAEMGDQSFQLGHVDHDYEQIFGGPLLRALVAGSCQETTPGCSECALAPFCGSDPVFHWATQGDPIGHRPTSEFCGKNMEIIKHLFNLLRSDDLFVRDLFLKWAVYPDGPIQSEQGQ